MKFKRIENYKTSENSYIVYDEVSKNGFVIDPGCKTEDILKAAAEDEINIKYVFLTHCHYDHIEYMEDLREKTSALLVCSKNCADNIKNPMINLSQMGLGYKIIAKDAEIVLDDNEDFKIDGINVKCIYTPGHTNCSACFMVENELFCGDTLFLRNCGRWDLPTGDEMTLVKSVKEKIYTLDENINLHPGHGEKTTIGYEKKFNFFIKD